MELTHPPAIAGQKAVTNARVPGCGVEHGLAVSRRMDLTFDGCARVVLTRR